MAWYQGKYGHYCRAAMCGNHWTAGGDPEGRKISRNELGPENSASNCQAVPTAIGSGIYCFFGLCRLGGQGMIGTRKTEESEKIIEYRARAIVVLQAVASHIYVANT